MKLKMIKDKMESNPPNIKPIVNTNVFAKFKMLKPINIMEEIYKIHHQKDFKYNYQKFTVPLDILISNVDDNIKILDKYEYKIDRWVFGRDIVMLSLIAYYGEQLMKDYLEKQGYSLTKTNAELDKRGIDFIYIDPNGIEGYLQVKPWTERFRSKSDLGKMNKYNNDKPLMIAYYQKHTISKAASYNNVLLETKAILK